MNASNNNNLLEKSDAGSFFWPSLDMDKTPPDMPR